MLKSSLCDYSDAYILVNGGRTITGSRDDATVRQAYERNKAVTLTYCHCINKINNAKEEKCGNIDV